MKFKGLTVLVLFLTVSILFAGCTKQPSGDGGGKPTIDALKPVKLEFKMAEGEAVNYKVNMTMESTMTQKEGKPQSNKSEVEMMMTQTCKKVDPDGTMTIEVKMGKGKMIMDGQEQPINEEKTMTMKMKKNGEIVETEENMPLEQVKLPDKEVKKGDTWEGSSKVPGPSQPNEKGEEPKLVYKFTFDNLDKLGDYDCAVIKSVCPETKIPLGDKNEMIMNAEGMTYFAPKEGKLVKSEMKSTMKAEAPDKSGSMEMKMTMVMELVKPGEEPKTEEKAGMEKPKAEPGKEAPPKAEATGMEAPKPEEGALKDHKAEGTPKAEAPAVESGDKAPAPAPPASPEGAVKEEPKIH